MKYIRTPFTIFEVLEETDIIYRVKAKGNPHNIYSKSKCQTEVVKSADTIEELCDEFVLDHPLFANNCKNLYHSFEKAKNGIKKRSGDAHDLYSFEIFGAIWTDKGLIYVAKMNSKGELELL